MLNEQNPPHGFPTATGSATMPNTRRPSEYTQCQDSPQQPGIFGRVPHLPQPTGTQDVQRRFTGMRGGKRRRSHRCQLHANRHLRLLKTPMTKPAKITALRKRNPIWDTLVELFGEPSPTRTALYGRVTQYLTEQEASPDQIRYRATRIVTDWGPQALTLTSLEKHWSRFDGLAGQITRSDAESAQRQTEREERRRTVREALGDTT